MTTPSDARVVLVTAPDLEVARQLARTLVSEARIACANVVPGLESIYRWEGEVQVDAEVLLILKTTAAQVDAVAARVKDLHPYELPEVIALPIEGGSAGYLDWIRTESTG
ncbi:MAG: divalent-cation tolerance protein CutA [Myxococcota bacterium]